MPDFHIIENEFLKITASENGAELHSIYNKKNGLEYLWQGAKEIWGRRAPVLFPIVGRLYRDTYIYKDKEYKMNQHGFARDQVFDLLVSGEHQLTFLLTESDEILQKYPFPFNLYISYKLDRNKLYVLYEVQNTGEDQMYFSIGGHPGFNCPLNVGDSYEDYSLVFEKNTYETYLLQGNFQSGVSKTLNFKDQVLEISQALFENDAIIFKNHEVQKITFWDKNRNHGLSFTTNMPYFGIWSPKNTNKFLCLEPWCGIADYEKTTNLEDKEGINILQKGHIFKSNYEVEVL